MQTAPFLINNNYTSPEDIDYNIRGLYKQILINSYGEMYEANYYREYDGITYTTLVVSESRIYTRNTTTGLAIYRIQTSSFYLTDGTVGTVKTTKKYYTPQLAILEGETRRTNMIGNAKVYLIGAAGLANAQSVLVSLIDPIVIYVNGFTTPLITGIQNSASTYSFMTASIINELVAILSVPMPLSEAP